jgi:hypothetical protein
VDVGPRPGKHIGVTRRAGDGAGRRPQPLHRPWTPADLRRDRLVHSIHTPYYGDALSVLSTRLYQAMWATPGRNVLEAAS